MNSWITSAETLATWLAHAGSHASVALDTEFVRERTFHPQLALVQLAWNSGEVALVDVLALAEPAALVALLEDRALAKVMHSASEDLQALHRHYGVLPQPLFDTQIAAAMCGLGAGLSYQKLVAELLGVQLEKGETRSDWLRRPLSESQLHYAAEDVRHLGEAHARLDARLRELGRLAWLEEDCQRLLDNAIRDDEPHPHLASRSAQRMDPAQQARLCRLLRWRDARARESDKPRSWIMDAELSTTLAMRPPTDRRSFESLLDGMPRAPRRHRGELWDLVSRPLAADEQAIPLACLPDPALKPLLKRAQSAVADIARELDIPEGLLASKRHLETLLETATWPEHLSGWRRALLEPALGPILSERP